MLQELGILKRVADGGEVKRNDDEVEMSKLLGFRHHKTMPQFAQQSLEEGTEKDSDFSSMTLALDAGGMEYVKERLAELREDLLKRRADSANPKEVVQVNLQAVLAAS